MEETCDVTKLLLQMQGDQQAPRVCCPSFTASCDR
jgi:hypothetical protein